MARHFDRYRTYPALSAVIIAMLITAIATITSSGSDGNQPIAQTSETVSPNGAGADPGLPPVPAPAEGAPASNAAARPPVGTGSSGSGSAEAQVQQGGGQQDVPANGSRSALSEGGTVDRGPVSGGNTLDTQPEPKNAPGSPVGGSGDKPALPSPIRVPLPTQNVSGAKFEIAVDRLREPITQACGGQGCITVGRVVDSDFDTTQLDTNSCDTVRSVVGAEGVFPEQTATVERGGTLQLLVAPSCDSLPPPPAGGAP